MIYIRENFVTYYKDRYTKKTYAIYKNPTSSEFKDLWKEKDDPQKDTLRINFIIIHKGKPQSSTNDIYFFNGNLTHSMVLKELNFPEWPTATHSAIDTYDFFLNFFDGFGRLHRDLHFKLDGSNISDYIQQLALVLKTKYKSEGLLEKFQKARNIINWTNKYIPIADIKELDEDILEIE